jgi:hypothetical protein
MEGVMIYIVIYKEISLALTLDSAHTKIWLQDLHPNIQGESLGKGYCPDCCECLVIVANIEYRYR